MRTTLSVWVFLLRGRRNEKSVITRIGPFSIGFFCSQPRASLLSLKDFSVFFSQVRLLTMVARFGLAIFSCCDFGIFLFFTSTWRLGSTKLSKQCPLFLFFFFVLFCFAAAGDAFSFSSL